MKNLTYFTYIIALMLISQSAFGTKIDESMPNEGVQDPSVADAGVQDPSVTDEGVVDGSSEPGQQSLSIDFKPASRDELLTQGLNQQQIFKKIEATNTLVYELTKIIESIRSSRHSEDTQQLSRILRKLQQEKDLMAILTGRVTIENQDIHQLHQQIQQLQQEIRELEQQTNNLQPEEVLQERLRYQRNKYDRMFSVLSEFKKTHPDAVRPEEEVHPEGQ